MFWLIRFILEWSVWLVFADKKRWREIFPVCILACMLAWITDASTHHYKLWEYDMGFISELSNSFGIYIVVTYLFIQWLPDRRFFMRMLAYWFIWTTVAISIEYIHLKTGHMTHHQWWTLWHSYIADWVIFWLFYQYHKVFQLAKLR